MKYISHEKSNEDSKETLLPSIFAITGLEIESFLKDLVIMNRSVMS